MKVVSLILAGGEGTRLFPLTKSAAKPMVRLGNLRLLDIPLSHSIRSERVVSTFVLTQFLSDGIERYLEAPQFQSVNETRRPIALPPQKNIYEGTADAVRKHLSLLERLDANYVAILSGDQIYQMDMESFFEHARKTDADLVIATLPVEAKEACRYGVMKVNQESRIELFMEKPSDPTPFSSFPESKKSHLVSMGIYLFKKEFLIQILKEHPGHDFGKEIIPYAMMRGSVFAFPYHGFWEDIGTLESFYRTALLFTEQPAPIDPSLHLFENEKLPSHLHECHLIKSMICAGAQGDRCHLINSLVGPSCRLGVESHLENCLLLGDVSLGNGCHLSGVIIDEGASIASGLSLMGGAPNLKGEISPGLFASNGLLIVARGAHIDHSVDLRVA